jgi:hypothetical protein
MPTFMDYHDDLKLPPEAIEQVAQEARDGARASRLRLDL